MLKLIHNVPSVCLYKIQSLNSFKIPDADAEIDWIDKMTLF